jgi:TatD DNase family protein
MEARGRVIDSHAHLYFDGFDGDRDEVIARARAAGVAAIINIGIDPESSEKAVDLARRHEGLFAAAGVHPTSRVPDELAALERVESIARANQDRVVAIGEIGLDYYWKDVSHDVQKERLRAQLALARRLGLPVVFHCRDALEDLLGILEGEEDLPAGVFHCFSGGVPEADRALRLGFHVSFAGNVTYPKAVTLQEAALRVPLERLLLETDCPFLSPVPVRGKRNEPAHVAHTRDFLARLKGVPERQVEDSTDAAARKLFGLHAAREGDGAGR